VFFFFFCGCRYESLVYVLHKFCLGIKALLLINLCIFRRKETSFRIISIEICYYTQLYVLSNVLIIPLKKQNKRLLCASARNNFPAVTQKENKEA